MAQTIAVPGDYAEFAPDTATTQRRPAAPSLLARLRSLFGGAQSSEVEGFIQANGGALTDDLEREISRRFGRIVGN